MRGLIRLDDAPAWWLLGYLFETVRDQIELIDKPLLMIAGSKADSLYMSQQVFAKATGTRDKKLFTIDGATHIDTYWVPAYVDVAMGQLTAFYARTL